MTRRSRPERPAGAPVIRAAAAATDDVEAIAALWRVCGLLKPYNDVREDIALCRATPHAELFVADDGGAIVATAMAGHDGHRGWLYYVATDPARRGEGLGRRMVAHAEAWLAAHGVRKVNLMVGEENARAQGFYERLGYAVTPNTVMARWLVAPAAASDASAASTKTRG